MGDIVSTSHLVRVVSGAQGVWVQVKGAEGSDRQRQTCGNSTERIWFADCQVILSVSTHYLDSYLGSFTVTSMALQAGEEVISLWLPHRAASVFGHQTGRWC